MKNQSRGFVQLGKYLVGELSGRGIVLSGNCPVGELSVGEMSVGELSGNRLQCCTVFFLVSMEKVSC